MSDAPTLAERKAAPSDMAYPFRTVEADGTPVKRRFTTARAVRDINYRLQQSDIVEASRRTKILRVYDGFPPFDQERLKSLGLGNISNINFLELKGLIDARSDILCRIATDTTPLVELHSIRPEIGGPEMETIKTVIAEEFSDVMRENPRFISTLSMMNRECDLYGLGPVTWPTREDYMPIALERGQVRFRPNASVISSENDLYQFETEMPAQYLIALLDDPESAEAQGWNMTAVKAYLIKCFHEHVDTRMSSANEMGTSVMESAIEMMRQNRIFETRQFDVMRVLHTFTKEVSGARKISHIITAPNQVATPPTENTNDRPNASEEDFTDDFLFYKLDAYDNMNQCMIWFPYQINVRFARAVRGLASFVLPIVDINNRFTNMIYDSGFRSAAFVLQRKTPGPLSTQTTIIERGPYTILDSEFTPIPQQPDPNLQQLVGLREFGSNLSENNAMGRRGSSMQRPERIYSGADRKTKEEVQLELANGSRSEERLFTYRVCVLDMIVKESFRRALQILKNGDTDLYPELGEMAKRCELRGVPREVLEAALDNFKLYICRELIHGGSEGKAGMLRDLMEFGGGTMDEAGRKAALRDYAKARFGARNADRYVPEVNRDETPSNSMSLAVLENELMASGKEAVVGIDQLHWTHIPTHVRVVQAIVEAVQNPQPGNQIEDPERALTVLETVSQHLQAHNDIGRMQIGMEPEGKKVDQFLRSLGNIAKMLNMMAQAQKKEQEAAARQQELEQQKLQEEADRARVEIEKHKIDKDAEVKRYKVDREAEILAEKVRQDHGLARTKVAGDLENSRLQAANTAQAQQSVDQIRGVPTPGEFDLGQGQAPDASVEGL